jgi:hypothetical protein
VRASSKRLPAAIGRRAVNSASVGGTFFLGKAMRARRGFPAPVAGAGAVGLAGREVFAGGAFAAGLVR